MRSNVMREACRHQEIAPVMLCHLGSLFQPVQTPPTELEGRETNALQLELIEIVAERKIVSALID